MDLEKERDAYKKFYEGVQFAMDNLIDSYEVFTEIDQLTDELCDAITVRH